MSHWADIIDNLNMDAEWHEVAAKKSREYGGDGHEENTAIADAHRRAAKLLTDCQDIAAEIRRAEVKALRAARIELGTLANSTLVAPWELMNALDARIKRFEAA